MKVLVACEFSGIVRDAFIARGHDAVSCDLIPSIAPGPHIQADIRTVDLTGVDLLIAHPDCTYLCSSGVRWLKNNPERQAAQEAAVEFVNWLMARPVPKIAIENPIGVLSTRIRKPDQILQPWQFGHGETKATCIWMKGLKKLAPTNIVDGRAPKVHFESPGIKNGLTRQQRRSLTYTGIADAMAEQWGQNESNSGTDLRPTAGRDFMRADSDFQRSLFCAHPAASGI